MESIFEKDFFPTPESVISRMLAGHEITGKIVLEPSAGSGNIVNYLQKNYAKEVIACEKNSKLRRIVESKCRVIADDFLTVRSEDISHVDAIVMNPPFSDARRHILHAYEIAPEGCEIIALCNSSDLNGGWRETEDRRRVMELVENYGYSENFGQCFDNAERKTNVYVSCIHLYKPKSGKFEFEDYLFSEDADVDLSGSVEGIMKYDVVRDVVVRYIEAVKRYDSVMAASEEINELTSLFRDRCCGYGIKFGAYDNRSSGTRFYGGITREIFKKDLQKQAWVYVIDKLNLGRFSTSRVREMINKFVETQKCVPFTMHNIYQMIYMIVNTRGNLMNIAIEEAFDNICSFSAENSTAGEKWKTNSNYMVNKRFIVPYITEVGFRGELRIRYDSSYNRISDMINALEYVTGKRVLNDIYDYVRANNLEFGKWHTCGSFFRFRGYKKGTMHFEFINDDDWELFNRRAAEIKGWEIGSKTKSKR